MRGVFEANLPRGGNRGAAALRHRRAVFVARHAPPMDAERNGDACRAQTLFTILPAQVP